MCLCLSAKTSTSPSLIFLVKQQFSHLDTACCSNPNTLAVFSVHSYYSSPVDFLYFNMSIERSYISCVHKAKNAMKMTEMGHYLDVSGLPPKKVRKHFHQITRAEQFYQKCETDVHLFIYLFCSLCLSFTWTMCSQGKACFRRQRCEWSVLAAHALQTHPLTLQ